MKLILLPNKILREKSKEVDLPLSKENIKLAEAMIKHIKDSQKEDSKHRNGIGIAAIQFGQPKRMFYINMVEDESGNVFEEFLINPIITGESSRYAALHSGEGCLSIGENWKNTEGFVHRKFKIRIKGYSYLSKKMIEISKTGYPAIAIQHEFDHLEGKLFIDRIDHKKVWEQKENEEIV